MLERKKNLYLMNKAEVGTGEVVLMEVQPHLVSIRECGNLSQYRLIHQLNNNEKSLV